MDPCSKCGMVPYGPYHECPDVPPGTKRGARFILHDFDDRAHLYGVPCQRCVDNENSPPNGYYTITKVTNEPL